MTPVEQLVADLTAIVGVSGVLTGNDLHSRAASWLYPLPNEAIALVRPSSTSEVAAVMATCYRLRQRVVVQGGMTGLVDGARPERNEVIVSLERMHGIECVDPVNRVAVLQAGVTLQAAQEAAGAAGLMLAADWGARGSATVGGAIATNGGGLNVIRYGMMREQVLGLEVVLSDGTVLPMMNRLIKNNAGYDLKQLFIGSEGTLGIITRAVVRLRPATQTTNTAMVATGGMDETARLLALLDAELDGTLTAFEVLWPSFYEIMVTQRGGSPPLALGYPVYVLLEARGVHPEHDADRFERVLERAVAEALVRDAIVCTSERQRDALWALREDIPMLSAALSPMIVFDVSLPISAMQNYLDNVWRAVESKYPGARGAAFGHIGDCNVHMCWGVGDDDDATRECLSNIVYSELGPIGGSISAEHGIGREKRDYLMLSRSTAEVGWMEKLKHLMDPRAILNADRVIPSTPLRNT